MVGLHFALLEPEPVVWVLPPFELIRQSFPEACNEFPLTWYHPEQGTNLGAVNVDGAWENEAKGTQLPMAIAPMNFHPRISVQRSCFTIHGKDQRSLTEQVPHLLKRYDIEPSERHAMQKDLRLLGIGHSTVFPDLDGLAKELAARY